MNNLLVWPLSENTKIIFLSQSATLSTITCCDQIDIRFEVDQKHYILISNLTGCQLSAFKQSLQDIIVDKTNKASLQDTLLISKPILGDLLLEIHKDNQTFAYFLIAIDIMQAWATQLDLLEVVMQENENEKKTRGKGCC
jgi:hypothetical protein